jgi:hypothetical protein
MRIKSGKAEIVYLLGKVIEQYETRHNTQIIRNSNRKNYEDLARELSKISNELPHTAAQLQHDDYTPDFNPKNLDYPFRKYDITGNQIKDAYFNQIVSKPRPFLVDACYIYLYGVGRKGFEAHPVDENLLEDADQAEESAGKETEDLGVSQRTQAIKSYLPWILAGLCLLALLIVGRQWVHTRNELSGLRHDMRLLPYKPSQQEIDSLEGIWLCYTGSPQARISDPNRYHLVVANVVDVKYKNGYFVFDRYGASFDHVGYMQYEAPWLLSIHSHVKNDIDSIESPRHSLMRLDRPSKLKSVISASWSFDVGNSNNIIGIREVYVKQGKGGTVEEVLNTPENASCRCKIILWKNGDKQTKFYLRNKRLETLTDDSLKLLIDDKSILARTPQEGLVIRDSSEEK